MNEKYWDEKILEVQDALLEFMLETEANDVKTILKQIASDQREACWEAAGDIAFEDKDRPINVIGRCQAAILSAEINS